MHTAGQADVDFRVKDGKFEIAEHAGARRVGRDAGRRGAHLPQHERVGAARGLRADAVLRAQPEPAADARKLRGAARSGQRDQRRLAGASEPRHQPRVSDRHRSARTARWPSSPSVCAPLVYRGDRLPAELYGNVFVAEPAAQFVSRIILTDDGTTLRARKAYDNARVPGVDRRALPSGLPVERPRRDAVRRRHVPRDHPGPRLDDGVPARSHHQRASSISRSGWAASTASCTRRRGATRRGRSRRRRRRSSWRRSSHPNGWWRDTRAAAARRARRDRRWSPALTSSPRARRIRGRACTRCGRSTASTASSRATVTKALDDTSRDVRVAAIRIAERWLGEADHPMQAAVLKRLDDADWAVRHQLAASLGALPAGPREAAAVAFLERHAGDPIALDAALSGLRGSETGGPGEDAAGPVTPDDGRSAKRRTPRRRVTMLAATIVRGGQDGAVQNIFTWMADENRPALAAFGAAARRGGRAARRGDARVSDADDEAAAGGRGCRVRRVRADERVPAVRTRFRAGQLDPAGAAAACGRTGPAAESRACGLSALAARGGDLGPRAASAAGARRVARQAGRRGAVAPLDGGRAAALRRRAGGLQEHLPGLPSAGRARSGEARAQPRRLGADAGPAEIPARILLNGKEGGIGLMPPVGRPSRTIRSPPC